MRYIFYADIYFVQNFMMKMTVLYLVLFFNRRIKITTSIKGIIRIGMVSSLFTMLEIIGMLSGISYSLFLIVINLFEIPVMFLLVLGKERGKIYKLLLMGYFFTIIINGILEALWNQFGEVGSYIFYVIFSCGTVIVVSRLWNSYSKMKKGIFTVELWNKSNEVQSKGLYDSGNRLKDPYTGKGVHIVSDKLLKGLIKEQKAPVYIPYQALGNSEAMLEVFYIDKMEIELEKQKKIIENCPVGVTKDNLFEGKIYEIILNEEVV